MLIVPGRDCSDCGVQIDGRSLQALSLKTFSSPSASSRTVIAEAATNTIVGVCASEQGVDLLHGCLCTAEPQFQHSPNRRRQLRIEQLILDCPSIQLLYRAAVIPKPSRQPRNLGDGGDVAGRVLGNLLINFRPCLFCDPVGGFSKGTLYQETTTIDLIAKLPFR